MDVQTRRSFVRESLSLPILVSCASARPPGDSIVISQPDCLSQESAQAFRAILGRAAAEQHLFSMPKLVVLSGASAVTRDHAVDLRSQAERGAWVVWETSPVYASEAAFGEQRGILEAVFGISLAEPIVLSPARLQAHGMYVRYVWPRGMLTRTFLALVPVISEANETIAYYGRIPVAAKRRIGQGGIVVLGSMLGPNVRAAEREAAEITTEIFRSLG